MLPNLNEIFFLFFKLLNEFVRIKKEYSLQTQI